MSASGRRFFDELAREGLSYGREVAHAVKTRASRPSRSASPGVPRRFCAGKNGSPSWWRWSVFQDPSTAWVRAVTAVAARADTPLYGATAHAKEEVVGRCGCIRAKDTVPWRGP